MKKKTKGIFILVSIGLIMTTGFIGGSELKEYSENSYYPITVRDKLGKTITIKERPHKIVSLAPSNSEILLSLGLEEEVIGVTTYCPSEFENKTKIGSFSGISAEKVIELNPDVVFAVPGVQKEVVEQLDKADIKVVTLGARDIEGIYEDIEIVGKIMKKQTKTKKIINYMKDSIDSVQKKISGYDKKKAFYILWYPTMTVGRRTFIHDVLLKSGLKNIAGDSNTAFPIYSEEKLIKRNPGVIIYSKHSNTTKKKVKDHKGWRTIKAVKKGDIYEISDDLINQPCPKVVKAIEQLARKIYPKAFESSHSKDVFKTYLDIGVGIHVSSDLIKIHQSVENPRTSIGILREEDTIDVTLESNKNRQSIIEFKTTTKEYIGNAYLHVNYIGPETHKIQKNSNTYTYTNITLLNINKTQIKNSKVIFRVKEAWIEKMGAMKEDITLKKYDHCKKEWESLETTFLNKKDNYYRFSAQTPEFTVFAVSLKNGSKSKTKIDQRIFDSIFQEKEKNKYNDLIIGKAGAKKVRAKYTENTMSYQNTKYKSVWQKEDYAIIQTKNNKTLIVGTHRYGTKAGTLYYKKKKPKQTVIIRWKDHNNDKEPQIKEIDKVSS